MCHVLDCRKRLERQFSFSIQVIHGRLALILNRWAMTKFVSLIFDIAEFKHDNRCGA